MYELVYKLSTVSPPMASIPSDIRTSLDDAVLKMVKNDSDCELFVNDHFDGRGDIFMGFVLAQPVSKLTVTANGRVLSKHKNLEADKFYFLVDDMLCLPRMNFVRLKLESKESIIYTIVHAILSLEHRVKLDNYTYWVIGSDIIRLGGGLVSRDSDPEMARKLRGMTYWRGSPKHIDWITRKF